MGQPATASVPSVLLVYYSYTQQTRRVVEEMASVLRGRGCRPAQIRIPDIVTERDYDLVCIGSPTWWLSSDVPIRSFLESDTAGQVLNGKPFAAAVCCRRYWRHNLKTVRRLGTKSGGAFQDYHLGAARKFADGLADRLLADSIGAHAKGRSV
jgi:flavodoxin